MKLLIIINKNNQVLVLLYVSTY